MNPNSHTPPPPPRQTSQDVTNDSNGPSRPQGDHGQQGNFQAGQQREESGSIPQLSDSQDSRPSSNSEAGRGTNTRQAVDNRVRRQAPRKSLLRSGPISLQQNTHRSSREVMDRVRRESFRQKMLSLARREASEAAKQKPNEVSRAIPTPSSLPGVVSRATNSLNARKEQKEAHKHHPTGDTVLGPTYATSSTGSEPARNESTAATSAPAQNVSKADFDQHREEGGQAETARGLTRAENGIAEAMASAAILKQQIASSALCIQQQATQISKLSDQLRQTQAVIDKIRRQNKEEANN